MVLCLIIFGLVTYVLFAVWEWKGAKYPIIPMDIFNSVTNCATLAVVFLHSFVFISASYYLPLYFQSILGMSTILSGVSFLPMSVAVAIGSVAAGIYMGKTQRFLEPILGCFVLMATGFGLFIDLNASSGWAKRIVYQIVAGVGVGLGYQAPYIALQAHVNPRDIAPATASLGFSNLIATAISVVIGQVVYQNEMVKKEPILDVALSPILDCEESARIIEGGNAGISTDLIKSLPEPQRSIVRKAFADALQPMWIVYTSFAVLGLLVALLIKRKKLTSQHEETKTGLEAEKANAEARAAEREARKAARRDKKLGSPNASQDSIQREVVDANSEEILDRAGHDLCNAFRVRLQQKAIAIGRRTE